MSMTDLDECGSTYNGLLPMASQDVVEAMFRYDLLERDSTVIDPQSLLSIHHMMKLFLAAEKKLEDIKTNQHKEMNEVQKYVDHVRTLSEERDKLTIEFERENEKLKMELENLHKRADEEKSEVMDMCRQEGLDELVGSNFSEQMAYLLVVRATLMDKVEALQEQLEASDQQCAKLNAQINSLVSEDGELRQRMTNAMSEMGGMASKLTESLQEKDRLQQEVVELKQALEGVRNLPAVKEARAESAARLLDLEKQREFYGKEIEKLRTDVEEAKQDEQSSRLELTTQIEELQEMNVNLKQVNKKLNEQLDLTSVGSADFDDSRRNVMSQSQKIIEEMHNALEADEAKNRAQQVEHQRELRTLQDRIAQLENDKNADPAGRHGNDELVSELRAQLSEARSEHERLCGEMTVLTERLNSAQRDLAMRKAAGEGWKEQRASHARLTTELQERNSSLEKELTKVWNQLKDSLEKLNRSERERSALELRIREIEEFDDSAMTKQRASERDEVKRLRSKIKEMEERLFAETSGTSGDNKAVELQTRLRVSEEQRERETSLRVNLEEELRELRETLGKARGVEEELRKSVSELQKRALNAETQMLLTNGEKDKQETEKLVAELNRTQLEDAIELMRDRMELFASQARNYTDRYKNLKLKHKSKIRRIRELFLLERKATAEELESLERRLASAEEALDKELAWKEEAARGVRECEEGRRKAISASDNARKQLEESIEKISHLSYVNNDLDSKNHDLLKQLSLLERQKQELNKVIESRERKKQKEELQTLLSSLNMSGSLPLLSNDGSGLTSCDPVVTSNGPLSASKDLTSFDFLASHEAGLARNETRKHSSSYLNLTDSGIPPLPLSVSRDPKSS